jgi:cytochrome P450
MTLYPAMQKRLRDEINAKISRDMNPTVEQLDGVDYLNNFVQEVLRFYPPGTANPFPLQQAICDAENPDF